MIQHPQRHAERRKRFVTAMAAIGAAVALSACADFSGIQGHAKLREPSTLGTQPGASQPTQALPWLRADVWREWCHAERAVVGAPDLDGAGPFAVLARSARV